MEREELFFRFWTLKESYVKAGGLRDYRALSRIYPFRLVKMGKSPL